MSHDTINRDALSVEANTLNQVYRHLGALHATLAEVDRIDEGLQRRTLDRLMATLELIEEASGPPQPTHPARTRACFPLSHSPLRELDFATLKIDLPDHGLIAGDVGTVVFVHGDDEAYEVAFMTGDGRTLAVETLMANQLEPVAGGHILHLRKRAAV